VHGVPQFKQNAPVTSLQDCPALEMRQIVAGEKLRAAEGPMDLYFDATPGDAQA
jgi:hypothetical protein